MKREVILLLSLFLSFVLMGCSGLNNSTSSASVSSRTTTSIETNVSSITSISNTLTIGIKLDYEEDWLKDLNSKYNFVGDVYNLFEFTFPFEVTIVHEIETFFGSFLYDRASIISPEIEDSSIYDLLISQLESTCYETEIGESIPGTVFYADQYGNVLSISLVSENQIDLAIERWLTVFSNSNEIIDLYFAYPLSTYAPTIEASRLKVIEGCQACIVSDVVDGEYTYEYMGYTITISQVGAVWLDGTYHFSISHSEN